MSRDGEAELLRRFLPFIEGFFRTRVNVPEDAEDLAQEAAVAVMRSWPRFRHRSAATTWVYAICRNILCAHLRRRVRLPRCDPAYDTGAADRDGTDLLAIELALDGLCPLHRTLYELYYRRGCPVREIAAHVGKPEGTVKYELYRLRAALQRFLS